MGRSGLVRAAGVAFGLLLLAALALLLEPVRSAALGAWMGLPRRDGPAVPSAGIRTTPESAVALVGDLYLPSEGSRHPTVLIRTPYGRKPMRSLAGLFAERGYAVVLQDVRGTGDSPGDFVPFVNEASDGVDTVAWIRSQPWSNGRVGAWGPSYLAYVQWAILEGQPGGLDAIVPIASMARSHPVFYPSGVFALDLTLQWTGSIHDLIESGYRWPPPFRDILKGLWSGRGTAPRMRFLELPVAELDQRSLGRSYDFYQTFVRTPSPDAPYWRADDHSDLPLDGLPPAHLVVGWRDFCLETTLETYGRLRDAGARPHLIIGDYPHTDLPVIRESMRTGLSWFDRHLKGETDADPRPAVRYHVYGADEWREAESWPIASRPERWYLRGEGGLSRDRAGEAQSSSTYGYDPRDPTPSVGGPLFLDGSYFVDEAPLLARADVLSFTSAALEESKEIIGSASGEIAFQHSAATADLFVRLSRVGTDGVSRNIADRMLRVDDASGSARSVPFRLPPTAIRLVRGERLRVIVASGAHPRYARNLGIASENQLLEDAMVPSTQRVFHRRDLQSWIELPLPADGRHAARAGNPRP